MIDDPTSPVEQQWIPDPWIEFLTGPMTKDSEDGAMGSSMGATAVFDPVKVHARPMAAGYAIAALIEHGVRVVITRDQKHKHMESPDA